MEDVEVLLGLQLYRFRSTASITYRLGEPLRAQPLDPQGLTAAARGIDIGGDHGLTGERYRAGRRELRTLLLLYPLYEHNK